MIDKNLTIQGIVDRVDGDKSVLILEQFGRQQIFWPTELLPGGVKEGDFVYLSINTESALELEKEQAARQLLNEILSS